MAGAISGAADVITIITTISISHSEIVNALNTITFHRHLHHQQLLQVTQLVIPVLLQGASSLNTSRERAMQPDTVIPGDDGLSGIS